ncbi:MAG: DUF3754 domain-containing protein [Myxococcales bacterium]|nr:DUF3754 domain-containing protein [Myxococcales bacterium]
MAQAPARRVPTPVSTMGVQLPDDRYIPVRPDDLVDALVDDAASLSIGGDDLRALAEGLERVVSQEIEELRRGVDRAYDPHNPARDTLLVGGAEQLATRAAGLGPLVSYLLDKANYESLDDVQLDAALRAANSQGVRIRFEPERLETIELWVRGRTTARRSVRSLRRPIRGQEHEVELYRRLAVVFRAKGEDELNLKLFREIPVADVEALLPHAEVQMGALDRLKVLGGSLGAMGGVLAKLFETTVAATQMLWLAVLALGGLSVRSFLGYRRAKRLRLSQMTHHLYYQNVANNAGVLDQLVASIGNEELKESLLAYLVVRRSGVTSTEELRAEVSRWLDQRFGVAVDFDARDAVQTLERLGLWRDRGAWTLREPAEAIAELQRAWQERRTAGAHLAAAARRE